MRVTIRSAWLAFAALAVAASATPTELTNRQSTVKIMALGDSITGSPVRILHQYYCNTYLTMA